MTAKDCGAWEHVYQGWGNCPNFKKSKSGTLHAEDPACDNTCPHAKPITNKDK